MALFNRQISLTVGPEGSEQGIGIRGLRVNFKVKKSEKPETNNALIDIYNLSKDTREKLINIDDLVILNAGYFENVGVENVFIGNITNINHIKQGADIITKLECDDGAKVIRNTKVNLSYKEGSSAKEILNDVINLIPLASQFVDTTDIEDVQFVNGFSFLGPFKFVLEKLSSTLNLEWSIQDNELQIIRIGGTNKKQAIHLSPRTGLIGTPERVQDLSKQKNTERPGWRINSLLFPKISIGGLVSVESQLIKKGTFFRVINVEHNGDTWGNEWNTASEVEERK